MPRGMTRMVAMQRRTEMPQLRYLVLGLMCLVALVSIDTFNSQLSGVSDDLTVMQGGDIRPQVAALGLWLVLIAVSFIPGVAHSPPLTRGLAWPALLLAWVVLSPLWSDDPASGMPKAILFLATTFAAWRLASIVTTKEMLTCTFYSLFFLLALSFILAVFVPSVGLLLHDWAHEGQWKGVFGTKQGLGTVSAVFLVLAFLRLSHRKSLFNFAACALGLSCLLGSGSRGGGAMAVVAVVILVLVRRNPKFAPLVTGVLLIGVLLGILELSYFGITGDDAIRVFGSNINLTERTYIWQYAIGLWLDRPYLGFGLNSFWTNSDIASGYLNSHGWILDNYHSGYLAIAIETGVVGFVLFSVVSINLAPRLKFLLLNAKSNRLSLEMTAGVMVMFFTINLTETYFLRSTNFMAVLFTFLVIKTLAVPVAHEAKSDSIPQGVRPGLVGMRARVVS